MKRWVGKQCRAGPEGMKRWVGKECRAGPEGMKHWVGKQCRELVLRVCWVLMVIETV